VELCPDGASFIGRLKLRLEYRDRGTRVNFENHYPLFEVQEILKEPYSGQGFPGYENIDLSFDELETITRNERPDWKAALQSIKGIYLITDRISGGRYVGAAYGDVGVWSRWCDYVATGHGGNAGLLALLDQLPIPVKTEKVEEGLGPPGEGEEEMPRADFSMVASGLEIPGYRIVRNFGIVRGIIVRSRSVIGNLGAALQTIVGGDITILCEKTREDAFELLLQHAAEHGANAVISMRYDATEVMQGVTEVLAYGTPVQVERIP